MPAAQAPGGVGDDLGAHVRRRLPGVVPLREPGSDSSDPALGVAATEGRDVTTPPATAACTAACATRAAVSRATAADGPVAARAGRRLPVAEPLRADVRLSGGLPDLPAVPGGWPTVLADPPWRFTNRTGKVAPEHRRLDRYDTMTHAEICALPVADVVAERSHLYLWVPNALLPEGLEVLRAWGYRYVSNLVWAKRRKDGGPDGRGVGFYYRNTTELVLFGVRGRMRTLAPARSQVNIIETRKREHSRKPDELYEIIETCSPGPWLELFARYPRQGWAVWGDESPADVTPRGRQHPAYR